MIRIVQWAQETNAVVELAPADLGAFDAEILEPIIWIDLENPTPEEETQVFGHFMNLHPLTVEDITKPSREPASGGHLPKVEEFARYLFVIVNPLPEGALNPAIGTKLPRNWSRLRAQLSAIITRRVLITHHYDVMPCIGEAKGRLSRHPENLRRGPDYIFHLILDGIVDDYAPVVERFAAQLERLEGRMFKQPTQQMLMRLLSIKQNVSHLRKTMILEREVLARLVRGEFLLVDEREIAYYRNVYDHLVRYTELIESAREMVSDLLQTYLSATSNRLNEVMKTLTIISVIGAVCTVIAGIYGMNFKNMPELEWQLGYPMAIGLMLLSTATIFAVFKWKKWI